jgi:hypothetical protein
MSGWPEYDWTDAQVAAWMRKRRQEMAEEWAAMPIDDIEAGHREVIDVAAQIGVTGLHRPKRALLREIKRKVLGT